MDCEGEIEGKEEGREAVRQVGLVGGLVGVPDAVEEALPELPHAVVGDAGLRRQPRLEEDAEGALAGRLAAGRELLDQRRASLGAVHRSSAAAAAAAIGGGSEQAGVGGS